MVMIEGFAYGDGGGGNPREVVGDPMGFAGNLHVLSKRKKKKLIKQK